MTTASASLTSPGQLAANLPGILGFYPHDSLVFAAFTGTAHPDRFQLGPVMRLDLDDLRRLPDLADLLEQSGEELIFAFLVTQRPEEEIEDLTDTLIALVRTGVLPIQACWVTEQILTGEPIHLAFGPMYAEDDPWVTDRIAPIHLAQAMEPLLAQGELPDLTREDTLAQFQRSNPTFDDRECIQLTRFAHNRARELSPMVYEDVSADLRLLLDEVTDTPLEELLRDEETLLTMASLLGTVVLRDIIIADLLYQPEPAAQLLLAVARTFTGTLRHHALACYALCAIEMRLPMKALPALASALLEDPGHSLSSLIYDACLAGHFDVLIRAVRDGSHAERAGHGFTCPDASAA